MMEAVPNVNDAWDVTVELRERGCYCTGNGRLLTKLREFPDEVVDRKDK